MIFLPRKTAEMGIDIRSEETCGSLWNGRKASETPDFPTQPMAQEGQNKMGKGLASVRVTRDLVTDRGSSALILLNLWAPGSTGDHTA